MPQEITYNEAKTFGLASQCDGTIVPFAPSFQEDYLGDGCYLSASDHAIPAFHVGLISVFDAERSLLRCAECGATWRDVWGTICRRPISELVWP